MWLQILTGCLTINRLSSIIYYKKINFVRKWKFYFGRWQRNHDLKDMKWIKVRCSIEWTVQNTALISNTVQINNTKRAIVVSIITWCCNVTCKDTLFIHKKNNNEKLTIRGVSKLTTNNTGIFIVPKVIAYCSPNIIYTYFYMTIVCSTSIESNSTILTGSYNINL